MFLASFRSAYRRFRTWFAHYPLLRFLIVGGVNTGFSFGAYVVLLYVGLEYKLANLIAYVMGILFSFMTQGTVVFRNATVATFVKFVLATLLIYALNLGLIMVLIGRGFNPYMAGAAGIVPITAISYLLMKYVVFWRKSPVSVTPADR